MSTNDKTITHDQEAMAARVQAVVAADKVLRTLLRSADAAGLQKDMAVHCANRAAAACTGVDLLAELGQTSGTDLAGFGFGVQQPNPASAPARSIPRSTNKPIRGRGLPTFVNDWKAGRLPVPHSVCRTSELYRAYLLTCNDLDVDPIHIQSFLGLVEQLYPEATRSTVKVDGHSARLLIPRGERRKVPVERWVEHAAAEATRFHAALLEWESRN